MASDWTFRSVRRSGPVAWMIPGSVCLFALVLGVLLSARALLSSTLQAPSAPLLGLAGLLSLAIAALLHVAIQPLATRLYASSPSAAHATLVAPSLVLVLNLVALSKEQKMTATIPAGIVACLFVALLWRRFPVASRSPASVDPLAEPVEPVAPADSDVPAAPDPAFLEVEAVADMEEEDEAEGVLQQRVERRVVDGQSVIRLWQRLELPPWQREATVHLPFWPPLAECPEVFGEAVAESAASVKVIQVETYGCRLSVSVEEADERSQIVELEAFAVAPR